MAEHCPICGEKLRPDAILSWGGWHLDESGRELFVGSDRVYLTITAVSAVGALMRAQGRVVSKDGIYGAMYAMRPEVDQPDIKIVDVYMCKLKKHHPFLYSHIETIWGRGYRLKPLPEPHVAFADTLLPLTEVLRPVRTAAAAAYLDNDYDQKRQSKEGT